jgi:hypothetical protein
MTFLLDRASAQKMRGWKLLPERVASNGDFYAGGGLIHNIVAR